MSQNCQSIAFLGSKSFKVDLFRPIMMRCVFVFLYRPIIRSSPSILMQTDSSLTGWGAVRGHIQTNGRWSKPVKSAHINVLELKAAFLGLQTLRSEVSNTHIQQLNLTIQQLWHVLIIWVAVTPLNAIWLHAVFDCGVLTETYGWVPLTCQVSSIL